MYRLLAAGDPEWYQTRMTPSDQPTLERTRPQPRDIEELLQTSEPVLLAVDQVPFQVESRGVKNTFCLLAPLMTEVGAKLELEQFANRERVWWMLRGEIDPSEIHVGMIWTAPIERSREFGNPEREKDHFQVNRAGIRRGTLHCVEVLNLKVADPDLAELLDPDGIPWPHPPLDRVILRGGRSVVGPFSARYDHSRGRVVFTSLTPNNPLVYRMSRADFEAETELFELSYTANRWDAKKAESRVELDLMHGRDLEILQQQGDREDGATDEQIVFWALDLLEIRPDERQTFQSVLQRAGDLSSRAEVEKFPGRLERFLDLAENRSRITRLGSKIARTLSIHEGFKELVDRHIDDIASARVTQEIESRRSEIARQTSGAELRLAELAEQVAGEEKEYRQLRNEWERKFATEHQDRVKELEKHEKELEVREKEMFARLEALARTFHDDAREFGDQIVAQLPLLEQLGILQGRASGVETKPDPTATLERARAATTSPGTLALPTYLRTMRERKSVGEMQFLRQLESVATAKGFVFDRNDLINFHVLVKTGMWSVLTGPGACGKSSLPRLYAEALGCSVEFLHVPVRPHWSKDRDLLGAFNAREGWYEPARCGLLERLIAAQEDRRTGRGGIYIVCLDEMNLAPVEGYFAELLGILEQPARERHLELFSPEFGQAEDPYTPHRRLELGNNVRFVGTVNREETSRFFSPKIIDRAAIASLERPDLRVGLDKLGREGQEWRETQQAALTRLEPIHFEDFASWVRPIDARGETIEPLLKIDDAFSRSRDGLGFRLRDRVLRYTASAQHLLGTDTALDYALVQNVVPRLRPAAPRYIELLQELQGLLPPDRFPRTGTCLKALEREPGHSFFELP